MARITGTGMRLRGRIVRPLRYEDDPDVHERRRPYSKRNGSQPAFPELLAQQVVHYNPDHPPAAFPSLPSTGKLAQNEETAQQTGSNRGQQETRSSLDVARLVDDEPGNDNAVDFSMSNNIAAGDTSGIDTLNTDYEDLPEESVPWSTLELAYQHRIFCALCKTNEEQKAVEWLGLSDADATAIKKAVSWRKKHPITVTQQHAGQVNWLEPRLLTKYFKYLERISKYELGTPLQLLRAGMFLQQNKLPLELLGIWVLDPFGSGDLVDSTPLERHFPVGLLKARQLQHIYLHGAPELRPPVIQPDNITTQTSQRSDSVGQAQDRQPQQVPSKVVTLKYGKKRQSSGRPVGRPRKHPLPPATRPSESGTDAGEGGRKESVASISAGNGTSIASEDPLTEDASTLLSRWTQPLPAGISRNEGLASATPMQSAVASARDLATQIDPALLLPADTSTTVNNNRASSEASTSTVGRKAPRLKLKISTAGRASVDTSSPAPSSTAATGKSMGNFATTPSSRNNTPGSRTALVNQSLPPWSTPKSIRLKLQQPARAEDDFKTTTRDVPSLPSSSPTRFGEANNFDTKLVLDQPPTTPDANDLGVFANAEDYADRRSSLAGPPDVDMSDLLRQAREWAREEGSPTPTQRRVVAVSRTPRADEVVRSIEDDTDMPDVSILHDRSSRLTSMERSPLAGRGRVARNIHDAGRRSPSPPRSISPISINEDFEEYQAWLRGETGHGPLPQNLVVAGETTAPSAQTTQTQATAHQATQSPPMQTPAPQLQTSLASGPAPEIEAPGSKIVRLRIAVTNEELIEASRRNALGSDFVDPGEEGDAEWEEPAPKRKKLNTPKKASAKKETPQRAPPRTASSKRPTQQKAIPKKPTSKKTTPNQTPTRFQLNSTPKSAVTSKKTATKTKPAANQELLKRATRAQSLVVSEASDDPRTRSRSSTPTPAVEASSSKSKRKRSESIEPRRSSRLSSADVPDDDEAPPPVARQKKDAPLRAKLTPVSRLRKSVTLSHNTAVEQNVVESTPEVDSDASTASSKPRKKWTHKHYEKTRESSRLADMDTPNMKV